MKKIETKKVRVKKSLEVKAASRITKVSKTLAAPATDKQRKLLQLRKKKEQLREKKNDMATRMAHELHGINGEILKIKHGNKPKKKKPKPAKDKPKSYIGAR